MYRFNQDAVLWLIITILWRVSFVLGVYWASKCVFTILPLSTQICDINLMHILIYYWQKLSTIETFHYPEICLSCLIKYVNYGPRMKRCTPTLGTHKLQALSFHWPSCLFAGNTSLWLLSHFIVLSNLSMHIVKYALHWKLFQIKVVDLNEIFTFVISINYFVLWANFEESDGVQFWLSCKVTVIIGLYEPN
jgi:hypothetical protein